MPRRTAASGITDTRKKTRIRKRARPPEKEVDVRLPGQASFRLTEERRQLVRMPQASLAAAQLPLPRRFMP